METDYTLDTVGKFCPVPVIEAAHKIKEMNRDETLTVISDDDGFKPDISNWCSMTGNEYLGDSESDGVFKVFIRKTCE